VISVDNGRWPRFLAYLALGAWSLICVLPIYWVAISTLKPPIEFVGPPHYLPFVDFAPSVSAWTQILFDPNGEVPLRFFNSLIAAIGATALAVIAGAMAGYSLSRYRPRRTDSGTVGLVLAFVMGTRILPPLLTVLPLYYVSQWTGLYDTRWMLILVYAAVNLPISVWLMYGFFQEVPQELDDAAQLDGASRLRVFFTLILPIAKAGLAATSLLIFFLCWNEYIIAVYLTADHAMTMPPFLASQMTTREQMAAAEPDDYARLGVVVMLMFVPLLVFTGLFRRVFVRLSRPDGSSEDWSNGST
jgi:multiple sugar transport system permease protein